MSFKSKCKEYYTLWQDYKLAEKAYLKMQPDALDDKSFLPAALEIQETPPNPMGRRIIWLLCLFVVVSVLWASIGKVDIVASGQGKIIASGHTKIIQPLETGVVKAIHVTSGQIVKAGDIILELDVTQTDADRVRLEMQLPIAREKYKMTEKLFKEGASSKFELLTQQEALIELEQNLKKAVNRNQLQTLTAPIDGTIQELAIHTIGGVVTPAQELMKIVPQQAKLEAEILVPNKDIGFINEGQEVKIKLDAFPFTKYGMIDGVVLNINNDAIQDEELGLVFKAKISMAKSIMKVEDKTIQLTPGMSLSGEIKTGKRRIIEYFLSPVLKYQAEVIRER